MSDSVRPYRQPPTRLLCPQDSLGKNTGVGCRFFLHPLVYFYFHYSRRWVLEDLALIYVIECSAYVFLYEFIVSGLKFRSLIHFEFIFECGVRKCSNFIILRVAVQFSQHHLLKSCLCPIVYSCLLCQK